MMKPNLAKLEVLAVEVVTGKLNIDDVEKELDTSELLLLAGMIEAFQEATSRPATGPISVTKRAERIECEVLDEIEVQSQKRGPR